MAESPTYRVLLIGDQNTGKTSIIRTYIEGHFEENLPTPFPTTHKFNFSSPNGNFSFEVVDTSGAEEWMTYNAEYYQTTKAIIFVVSIDNQDSLDNILTKWKPHINEYLADISYKSFLAINKIDLSEQKILTDENIEQVKNNIGASVFYVSAKELTNINELFLNVAAALSKTPVENVQKGYAEVPQQEQSNCTCLIL